MANFLTTPAVNQPGQLPYLTHELQVVSPLTSILKYVSHLRPPAVDGDASGAHSPPDLDAHLSIQEKAQKAAWAAHVESQLGDLVAHMMYSLEVNWQQLIHPTLTSILPVPHRYYIPGRLRDTYRPRLEASELWNLPGVEQEDKPRFGEKKKPEEPKEHTFKRVFQREKVLEKAKSCLDIYARLLSDKPFFFHDRPTTLDVLLAAHVLLLIDPPYPDPLLKTLVTESYPQLVLHARSVYTRAFPDDNSYPSTVPPESYSLSSLVPWPKVGLFLGGTKKPKTEEDKQFDRMRWGWITLAVVGIAMYWLTFDASKLVSEVEEAEELNEEEEEE